MKTISILGSTGSIGVNALDVIRDNPGLYRVAALAAGKNIDLLHRQIREFNPEAVSVIDSHAADTLGKRLGEGPCPAVFHGQEGASRIATWDGVDTVVSAFTGAAGLVPTYAALRAGNHIALANKETMVMAGGLVTQEARARGLSLLPIDSEHCAVLQCLRGHPREDLRRVILTASGGPFRTATMDRLRTVTPGHALDHPNWKMGAKITIDSATLMNKGLETIEAKWFFDLEMDTIGILVHPQSIVHSMAEYRDGSVIAQMGIPDMRIPIAYALSYPRHLENRLPPLSLERIGTLTFETPDMEKFRCLRLALDAAEAGGTMPAVLNGANEIAVASFLEGRIAFLDIAGVIDRTMERHVTGALDTIDTVMEADGWARKTAAQMVNTHFSR